MCHHTMLESARNLFLHCKITTGIWSVLVFLCTVDNCRDSPYNLNLLGLPDQLDSFIKNSIIWTNAPLLFRNIPVIFNYSTSKFYLLNIIFQVVRLCPITEQSSFSWTLSYSFLLCCVLYRSLLEVGFFSLVKKLQENRTITVIHNFISILQPIFHE